MGRADAPVTLVEFSDFQCPFCLRHAKQTFERIKASYVDTGKVRYVFRHNPIQSLHPQAWGAARAAECAGRQGKFWQMHTAIFDNQKQMSEADLKGYARSAGVDIGAYDKCVADPAVTAKIQGDLDEGMRIGVTGTPMFFIGKIENGKLRTMKRVNGAESFERFQQAIDAVLSGS
jgi:protein-disulfide isomerase